MSGNLVPTMITRPLPWAASMGSEIRWDPMSSRYVPADYPMIYFDSHQKVGTYLHEIDTAYNRLVDGNRRAGLQPPLTLGIPSFYSQYEVALPVFDLVRSLDYEGITLQRVGVGKSPTELPIIQPNGEGGPALVVGARYEVCTSYDRGEVLPSLPGSNTPLRRLRGYDFKLTLLGHQAKLQTSCLVFSSETKGSHGQDQPDSGMPPLPLIDNAQYSFDSLIQNPRFLGEALESAVGPLIAAYWDHCSLRVVTELGAIYMDQAMTFDPRYLSSDQFLDFFAAAMAMEQWANREL